MSEPTDYVISSAPAPPEKISVRVPGMGVVRFPGTMTEGEIQARLAEITQPQGPFRNAVGTATEFLGKSILPTIGAGIGSIAGPGGTVLGSMTGEGANQVLGITPPSAQDIVASGVIPGAGIAGGKAAGAVTRRLPGATPLLHQMAGERLAARPGMLAPARSSNDLYALVEQYNPPIRTDGLRAAAEALAKTEEGLSKGLANDEIRNVGRGIVNLIDQHNGEVPFQTLRAELRRVGDRAGSLSTGTTGGETQGAYKKLFRTGHEDMETAAAAGNPAMPAVQALKEANTAFKMESVVDDLAEMFSVKGGGISPRPDLLGGEGVAVNFVSILKKLEKDPSIRKSMGDAAYNDMVADLKGMANRIPALSSAAGVDAGSKNVNIRAFGLGGAGTALGGYFFGGPGATVGGGLGAAAGAVGPQIIARLVSTKPGRSVLRGMLEGNRGVLSPEAIGVLGTAVGMSDTGRSATGAAVDFTKGLMGQ